MALKFGKVFVINLPSRTDHRDAMLVAATVSDIQLDWIDGVNGEQVSDRALPADTNRDVLGNGNVGSWRAHLNALSASVPLGLLCA
jgi:hypothetical protein